MLVRASSSRVVANLLRNTKKWSFTIPTRQTQSPSKASTSSSFGFASQVYERGTNVEQFVTRFLLKESANQIQSLLSSVESAVDAIDEQHSQSR